MAGCFNCENFELPQIEIGDRRNKIAAIASGFLFFLGWWIALDAAAVYPDKAELKDVFQICGVFGTISLFMINAVSNGQLRGEAYTTGCLGTHGARIWFFLGFLTGFGALIGSAYILFGEYVILNTNNAFKPTTSYPGVAIFLQNLLIFLASLIYKFGRSEDLWG